MFDAFLLACKPTLGVAVAGTADAVVESVGETEDETACEGVRGAHGTVVSDKNMSLDPVLVRLRRSHGWQRNRHNRRRYRRYWFNRRNEYWPIKTRCSINVLRILNITCTIVMPMDHVKIAHHSD